jgi:hypothetical protein
MLMEAMGLHVPGTVIGPATRFATNSPVRRRASIGIW